MYAIVQTLHNAIINARIDAINGNYLALDTMLTGLQTLVETWQKMYNENAHV